jgi:PAS domain S-box-containing protein
VLMKALLERKVLQSILDTVGDGIVNITPSGEIFRFNPAAEVIFGYKSEEVSGMKKKPRTKQT